MGLKVFVEEEEAVRTVKSVLERMATGRRAKGPVEFCISDHVTGTEVTINSGAEYPMTPQIKGALKSLGGVVMVEDI